MSDVGDPGLPGHLHPYVGPRPFRQADSGRFFGRQREARDVAALWMGDRVTVLHGPTGVGKTSLLHAGVLPLISRQADMRLLPVGGLGRQPAHALAVPPPFNGFSFALLSHWAPVERPPPPGESITNFLRERASAASTTGEHESLLAAIDQSEVLFTGFPAREKERTSFFAELAEALREVPSLKLLIVVSDDHLATLEAYAGRMSPYPFSYIRLEALSPAAALAAVTGPLTGSGRSFADGAAEELVELLRTVVYTDLTGESATITTDHVDPLLLQIVCAELWASLPRRATVITSGDMQTFGDVDQALARFYDSAVRATVRETGEPEAKVRAWIESAFITELGTRGTAYRGALTTAGMPNRIADAMEQHRVLTAEHRARGTWFQLGQDRMVSLVRAANRARSAELGHYAIPTAVPATPEALNTAAEAALTDGNYPSAHRFAEAAEAGFRRSGKTRRVGYTLSLRADIARAEGDLRAAEAHLHAALSLFTVLEDGNLVARTLSALADVRFAAGDYAEAARFQRDAINQLPTDVNALVGLGYAQWYGGSPADAAATFSQALGQDARAARAFCGRGQVLAEMEEYVPALSDLGPALEFGLPPAEEVDAHSARALALTGLGRNQEADHEMAIALSLGPARARTLRRAGQIAAMRDQPVLAAGEVERALHADPPLPPWEQAGARRLLAALRGGGSAA